MNEYKPQDLESKWQKKWEARGLYRAEDFSDKPKRYILLEFPYPSGNGLHVGHCLSYIALDVVSRYYRLKGDNVLFPMGWDAFGLPAENYAIKHKIQPREAVDKNIANFKRQIQSLGISFDWSREVNTTDPKFYQWTQWIFLQLFKAGLAEKKLTKINWCPKDKIGLAFEEVIAGKCERCDSEVEQREISQWVLKITKYADRLISDLDTVDYLPHIKKQQIDWIGRSEGLEISFKLSALSKTSSRDGSVESPDLQVFTTRPDTIYGATFLVIAPEHPLVQELGARSKEKGLIENWPEVEKYIKDTKKLTDRQRQEKKEITRVQLKGVNGINPMTQEQIPIFIADYVMMSYGTGAIMAVPAHDERDLQFAKKFNQPIKPVVIPDKALTAYQAVVNSKKINPSVEELVNCVRRGDFSYTGDGILVDSGEFSGLANNEAWNKIANTLLERGIAQRKVNYKLRDWIFSRQHYWGEPIPMIHCDHCKEVVESTPHQLNFRDEKIWKKLLSGEKTVETRALNPEEPERYFGNIKVGDLIACNYVSTGEKLYFKIKEVRNYQNLTAFAEDAEFTSQLDWPAIKTAVELERGYAFAPDYVAKINKNGLVAWKIKRIYPGIIPLRPEQLPLELPEVDHYEPTETGESPLAAISDWVNIICRVCGAPAKRETDTMPNWAGSSWYFLRYVDPSNDQVFAEKKKLDYWLPVDLYNGGMEHTTLHLLYSRFWHKFLFDQGLVSTAEPYKRRISHGMILGPDNQKMSKSRGNVINPDDIVAQYGADALRLYEMFMGEYDSVKVWSDSSLQGVYRFLKRVWNYGQTVTLTEVDNADLAVIIHTAIKKITEDIERRSFNTIVSQLMIVFNALEEHSAISAEQLSVFLRLLSPLAPHIADELWQTKIDNKKSIHESAWPVADERLLATQNITIAIQINGKTRLQMEVAPDISEEEITRQVLALPAVQAHTKGIQPKKIIYVPRKIVNIVI